MDQLEQEFSKFVKKTGDKLTPSNDQIEEAVHNIRMYVRNYVARHNLQSLVVYVNGTTCSSLVAALCQEEYTGVPLVGLHMNMSLNKIKSEQAEAVGKKYCSQFKHIYDPGGLNESLVGTLLFESFEPFENLGFERAANANVEKSKALYRIRKLILHHAATYGQGAVLGTNCWSAYLLQRNFVSGTDADISPIKHLNRGIDVPAFAEYLELEKDVFENYNSNTYKEIDIVMNGYLGNFDANLSTQLEKFRSLDKVREIILRHEFSARLREGEQSVSRKEMNLPTTFKY